MELLIKAGVLWSVSAPPLPGGWVAVDGGLIAAVGMPGDEPDCRETVDLSGHVVLPGFVNAHSHLQFSAARGKMAVRSPFTEWVREAISFSARFSERDMAQAAIGGAKEMMASGITAVGDVTSSPEVARAVAHSGLCAVMFAEAIAPHGRDAARAFENLLSLLGAIGSVGAMPGVSPHGPHTVSPGLFKRITQLAGERRLPVMCHVAESPEEVEFIRDGRGEFARLLAERGLLEEGFAGYGESPAGYLHKSGLLKKMLAVHLNGTAREEAGLLAEDGAVPVFCPGSSRWFGRDEVMPFGLFLERGLRPCIGTDSLASNGSLSMLDELRTARDYFPEVPAERLIECATFNGARALGLAAGALAPGLRADVSAFALEGKTPAEAVLAAERASFVMAGGRKIV